MYVSDKKSQYNNDTVRYCYRRVGILSCVYTCRPLEFVRAFIRVELTEQLAITVNSTRNSAT